MEGRGEKKDRRGEERGMRGRGGEGKAEQVNGQGKGKGERRGGGGSGLTGMEKANRPPLPPKYWLHFGSQFQNQLFVDLVPRVLESSAGGRRESLWGTGILLPRDFSGKSTQAVTGQPIKKCLFFFEFSRVSPGDQPLATEPEDSGYEIGFCKKQ